MLNDSISVTVKSNLYLDADKQLSVELVAIRASATIASQRVVTVGVAARCHLLAFVVVDTLAVIWMLDVSIWTGTSVAAHSILLTNDG